MDWLEACWRVLFLAQQILSAQGVANVLLVVNDASRLSRDIGQYYASRTGRAAQEYLPHPDR